VTIVLATSLAAIALAIWGVQAGKARLAAVQAARNSRGITLQTLIITAVLVLLAVAAGVVIAAITRSSQDDLEDTTADLEGIESQLGVLVGDEVRFDLVCATHQVPTLIGGGQHAGKLDCKTVCWVQLSQVGQYKAALLRTVNFRQQGMDNADSDTWYNGADTVDGVNRPDPVDGNAWPSTVTEFMRLEALSEADLKMEPAIKRSAISPLPIRGSGGDFANDEEGIIYSETEPDGGEVPNNGTVIVHGDSCFAIDDVCDIPQTRRQVVKERLRARSVQNPSGGPQTPELNLEAIRTIENC